MAFEQKSVATAVAKALGESRGKRKFRQSFDIAINFRDVDFSKPETRLNIDVVLPYAPRKAEVAIFADGQLAVDAKNVVPLVIASAQISSYASDKKKQKELLSYSLLAQSQLMAVVGKTLGQMLGSKGRLPKPIMPNANLADLVEKTKRTVTLRTKGKYLPVVHCIIGNEDMPAEQIAENVNTVLDAVKAKAGEPKIKSVLVKTTMGKPVQVAL